MSEYLFSDEIRNFYENVITISESLHDSLYEESTSFSEDGRPLRPSSNDSAKGVFEASRLLAEFYSERTSGRTQYEFENKIEDFSQLEDKISSHNNNYFKKPQQIQLADLYSAIADEEDLELDNMIEGQELILNRTVEQGNEIISKMIEEMAEEYREEDDSGIVVNQSSI